MLYIVGAGHAHPEGVIDNKFIEELDVGTSEEWILEKIGIETRATSLPLQYIASTRNRTVEEAVELSSSVVDELAIKAINMALDRARVTAEEIGMILCNCCTPRYTLPSQSERIAKIFNIDVPSFDVYTACPAFALHIDYLNKFNPEKLPKYVLCFSTAALTQHVNYNDRSDGAIWGDGAAAWIISPIKRGKLAVIDSVFEADPTRSQSVVVDTYGHFHQDGRAVRDFSVRQTVRLIKRLEAKYNIDWSRDIFIGHQANATMLRQICNNRKIPPSNHWSNVRTVGNQAGAGSAAVLSEHWEEIVPGQYIVIAVVGAGLSWGAALLKANNGINQEKGKEESTSYEDRGTT